jgi:integration host factor subunit alpha
VAGTSVTRVELAQAVYEAVGLPRHEAADLVGQVLEEISAALVRGENVKLSGFGNFMVLDKAQRVGRNPKTGVEVPIEPRKALSFRASGLLKERVNGEST